MAINYLHEQSTPADVWTVNHGLGLLPNVDVIIEENGVRQKILVDRITFIDEDNVELRFSTPRQGFARFATQGTIPFPAYDEFTISDEIIFYPNAQFNVIGSIIGRLPSTSNDASICVDRTNGKVYALYALLTADVVDLKVFDNIYEGSGYNELMRAQYPGYTGRFNIKGSCVWNDVIYFISHNGTASANNPKGPDNDYKLWKLDTVSGQLSEYLYSFITGGFCDVDTDGEYLYAITFEGVWFKLPLDEPSSENVIEQVDINDIPGVLSRKPGSLAYDPATGFFHVQQGASTRAGMVFDSYNGTLLDVNYQSTRVWFEFDNWFVYNNVVVGVLNRNIIVANYTYNNTQYQPNIDPQIASSLCQLTFSEYNNLRKSYNAITGETIDEIYASQYDGKIYAYADASRTIYVYPSITNDTLEKTIGLSHPVDNPAGFVVYGDKIHMWENGNGYFRFNINAAGTFANLDRFISTSFQQNNRSGIPMGMDVFNDELVFFVRHDLSGELQAYYGSQTFTSSTQMAPGARMRYAGWGPQHARMDTVTGHIYAYHAQGGGRAVVVYQSYINGNNIEVFSGSSEEIVVYGGKAFRKQGNGALFPSSLVDPVNNNICLI